MSDYYQNSSNIKPDNISKHLTKLSKLTSNKKLSIKNKTLKLGKETYNYNCWGFTAYAMKWNKNLLWEDEDVMQEYLDMKTEKVKTPMAGDIVRLSRYRGKYLVHTAIIIDPKKSLVLHKPGCLALEFNTIAGMKKIYGRYKVDFLRPTE